MLTCLKNFVANHLSNTSFDPASGLMTGSFQLKIQYPILIVLKRIRDRVIELKRLIEEMAIAASAKRLVPATWSVLEKILDGLPEKMGSSLCKIHVVAVFAHQLCHITNERELLAALNYLDEVIGSIIFSRRSEKLKNTIVTKPSWLFKVFSIVSSLDHPDPVFSDDWYRACQQGIMSWALTEHRLESAEVKPAEYSDVLNLLNCFFIL